MFEFLDAAFLSYVTGILAEKTWSSGYYNLSIPLKKCFKIRNATDRECSAFSLHNCANTILKSEVKG